MGRVEGKVALVTGAARGQGRAHALRLADEGADVIAIDLCADVETVHYPMPTRADLDETVAEVEKRDRRAVAKQVDVRDLGALTSAVQDAVTDLGRLDIVVANAGILSITLDEPTDPAERRRVWETTLATNLTGVWNTVEAVAPILVAAGNGGAVVLTSSTQGLKYAANNDIALTAYTASKHGVVGLMRCTAADLAPHGIRVNSVHPTGVNTPMVANQVMGDYGVKHPRLGDLMGNLLPVPVVEPEDVSEAVLYLVSDSGRHVTGVTMPVDAGHLLT
ncbi:mycofactocin-coupled SDR family oxidoreductase [Pseudonocardia endophytica]|uniref:SDR family mycofactocin-dependent oxidoreductase n=1 Tax=Pseudonocardia endophytica TaxID=401976 RepID=A0A4R1HNS4_PSEEN|nr:mycofactocin-coupled SDR family oxidoreductase [Pseudonocardia endophytica]TCK22030.1 SDR family mycofactocin-dependent oxidoreductase [Pseudonocardia endophytica]